MKKKTPKHVRRFTDVAWHRNGICGLPFYVVAFEPIPDASDTPKTLLAVVPYYDAEEEGHGCVKPNGDDVMVINPVEPSQRFRGADYYGAEVIAYLRDNVWND